MHESAFDKFKVFVDTYLGEQIGHPLTVLDVGSQAIDGAENHRSTIVNNGWRYVSLDMEAGDNVDLVVADAYDWREVKDDSCDVVLCSQVLEHARFPWRLVQEIARVLRPRGLAFLVAPSSGHMHRFPEDCFRYYPDGFSALAASAGLHVVESHVQERMVYRDNTWLDAVAVLQKPSRSPADAGRERARFHLARLMLKPDLAPSDLATVTFDASPATPSPFPDFGAAAPGTAFRERDAALARTLGPLHRLTLARQHVSRALKALTRAI